MTRGRRGWLLLRRTALSSATICRSPGAQRLLCPGSSRHTTRFGTILSVRPAGARNPLLGKGRRGDLGSSGPQRCRHFLSERRFLSKAGDFADLIPRFRGVANQDVIAYSRRDGFESLLPGRSGPGAYLAPKLPSRSALVGRRGSCGSADRSPRPTRSGLSTPGMLERFKRVDLRFGRMAESEAAIVAFTCSTSARSVPWPPTRPFRSVPARRRSRHGATGRPSMVRGPGLGPTPPTAP